jgi:hypothetical protein
MPNPDLLQKCMPEKGITGWQGQRRRAPPNNRARMGVFVINAAWRSAEKRPVCELMRGCFNSRNARRPRCFAPDSTPNKKGG